MDLNLDAICTILHSLVTKNLLHSLWELEGTTISLKIHQKVGQTCDMSKNSVAFEETEDNNFFVHFCTKKALCAMSRCC